jgi:16S rRNA processing protein RimM
VSKQQETEWATIGQVVAPFGLHGELKMRLLTDIPNRFTELETVYLGPSHRGYRIVGVRPYKGEMVVLTLEHVTDADTAEKLRNADVTIPLSQLAKLPPGSYYQHDILGLQVITLQGRQERLLGTIKDIIVTGGNDVYVIKAPDGKEILIPAIKDVVKQVDLNRKMMYIDAIEGLLDDVDATGVDAEMEAKLTGERADN